MHAIIHSNTRLSTLSAVPRNFRLPSQSLRFSVDATCEPPKKPYSRCALSRVHSVGPHRAAQLSISKWIRVSGRARRMSTGSLLRSATCQMAVARCYVWQWEPSHHVHSNERTIIWLHLIHGSISSVVWTAPVVPGSWLRWLTDWTSANMCNIGVPGGHKHHCKAPLACVSQTSSDPCECQAR